MFIASDYLRCRLDLTHEEAEALERFFKAYRVGGEMKSSDHGVVATILDGLVAHNEKIKAREAQIDSNTGPSQFKDAIVAGLQRIANTDLNQLKTAADTIPEVDLLDVPTLAQRMADTDRAQQRVAVDEQVGIYQVMRD